MINQQHRRYSVVFFVLLAALLLPFPTLANGGVSVTIVEVRDAYSTLYPTDNGVVAGTVAQNNVTATIDLTGQGIGTLELIDTTDTMTVLATRQVFVPGSASLSLQFPAPSHDPAERLLIARFTPNSGAAATSNQVALTIKPLPVVLVQGLTANSETWFSYVGPDGFLASIGSEGFAADNLNTGGEGVGFTFTTDQNAQLLGDYIDQTQAATEADTVDVVGISWGAIITRRYIARYMNRYDPNINQLVMLGPPNGGSNTATALSLLGILTNNEFTFIGDLYPGSYELTPAAMAFFNFFNSRTFGVPFYAVAGNLNGCFGIPFANPLEPDPDDILVSVSSVRAIDLDASWVFPDPVNGDCNGFHLTLHQDVPTFGGGPGIFNAYVGPLLQGEVPAPQTTLAAAPAAPSAIQFSDVDTYTIQPGEQLEVAWTPEIGTDTSFVVVGASDDVQVSLRSPDGQISTPDTTTAGVEYSAPDDPFSVEAFTVDASGAGATVAGAWTTIIEGADTLPTDGVTVATMTSLESDLQLVPLADSVTAPVINEPTTVTVELTDANNPITDATVTAQLLAPDNTTTDLTLYDDGQHGDGAAADGVYGVSFVPTTAGIYSAAVTATGKSDSAAFNRSTVWATSIDAQQSLQSVFLPVIQYE